ncbi:MAG: prepilin peptidase [Planctomycetota bacterium]
MPDWLLDSAGAPTWMEHVPQVAFYLWIAAFGGCVGSFFNVVLYRVPRGEDIVWRGSHCPECDHPIRGRHNLPVIGWLLLRGRCYDCKANISPVYPAIELAFALAFAGVAWLFVG